MTQPYVYVLEWTEHDRLYIGSQYATGCNPANLLVSYFTSSKYVKQFISQWGLPDYASITRFETKREALEHEALLTRVYNAVKSSRYLNKCCAGVFDPNDPDIRAKYAANGDNKRGIPLSAEHKAKIGEASRKSIRTAEWKANISAGNTGKKRTGAQNAALSARLMGRTSPRKGVVLSAEQIEKMRASRLGIKHSPETLAKMSADRRGRVYNTVTCPHCPKSGGEPAMRQWHFDHCKFRQIG